MRNKVQKKKKKLECSRLIDGKPDCGQKEKDCPILNPLKFIEIKPGTLVIADMGVTGFVVGIATKEKATFPEEVYVRATEFAKIGDRYSHGLPLQKEDLIPLIELPLKLSEALTPEEALSMFAPKIVVDLVLKNNELSKKVDGLANRIKKVSKAIARMKKAQS